MIRALVEVRDRLVSLMRDDPPFKLAAGEGGAVLDQWMARALSREELLILEKVELLYGQSTLVNLFAEALLEAGVVRRGDLI